MEETLLQLVELLKDASPVVWQILIKQVYVDAIANLLWATTLIFAAFRMYKPAAKKWGEEEDNPESLILWLFSGICALAGMVCLTDAVTHFLNPEFYAIQYILSKISG